MGQKSSQIKVDANKDQKYGAGKSSPVSLGASFKSSPVGKPGFTDADLDKTFESIVYDVSSDGSQLGPAGVVSSNPVFGSVNLKYEGTDADLPPHYADVKVGGGGLPASPFLPNPMSPGEGNGLNYAAQTDIGDDFRNEMAGHIAPFESHGVEYDPQTTSGKVGSVMSRKKLEFGHSPASSYIPSTDLS